jgi:hypothetical protein
VGIPAAVRFASPFSFGTFCPWCSIGGSREFCWKILVHILLGSTNLSHSSFMQKNWHPRG